MTPMPPACAIAMASRPSVTVSIAEEMIGRLRRIERVSRVETSTAPGSTVEWPGRSSTSSNARPSPISNLSAIAIVASLARRRAAPIWRRGLPREAPGA